MMTSQTLSGSRSVAANDVSISVPLIWPHRHPSLRPSLPPKPTCGSVCLIILKVLPVWTLMFYLSLCHCSSVLWHCVFKGNILYVVTIIPLFNMGPILNFHNIHYGMIISQYLIWFFCN